MGMRSLTSFLAGLVFGIGLLVSGMANPAKVLGFLDLAGAWDPSLAFVMAGAIAMGFFAFRAMTGRTVSPIGAELKLPGAAPIDRRLVAGSLLFGIGWGLAGFCPGPAVVAVGMAQGKAALFALAMIAGMALFELLERRRELVLRAEG